MKFSINKEVLQMFEMFDKSKKLRMMYYAALFVVFAYSLPPLVRAFNGG